MQLNVASFLVSLSELDRNIWIAWVESGLTSRGCIHLNRKGSQMPFSPLTAVYFNLTGVEIHRGTFWFEEMTRDFGMSWWDIQALTYASVKIDTQGTRYNRALRNKLLRALSLPMEEVMV